MRRLLSSALLLLAILAYSASSAQALPVVPDCKDVPTAQMPGNGLSDIFDPPPNPLPPKGDPWAAKPTTSIYDQSGYAGLSWSTYDVGVQGICVDTGATADTMIGNFFLTGATWSVAMANGLHNKIANPSIYMAPLDDITARTTKALKAAIWDPWGAVALLGLAGILLWRSTSGNLSSVTSAAAWGVLVVVVLSGLMAYPTRASQAFDATVTGAIGDVNAAAAGMAKLPVNSDPARAQGALLVDRILYDSWMRGELGAVDSPAAKRWGPTLFKASTNSWHAAAQAAKSPAFARQLVEGKANTWKATAAQIQVQDPAAYQILQGKVQGSRAGAGVLAAVGAGVTVPFRIVADLFVFAGLVLLRFLVMLAPLVAVLGVMVPGSALVHRAANAAGAAVVNVIGFSVVATVHTTAVSALLAGSVIARLNLLTLVLILVLTVVAFLFARPMLSLTAIVGTSKTRGGMQMLKRAGRTAVRYVTTKEGVEAGIEGAERDDEPDDLGPRQGPVTPDPKDGRQRLPDAEGFSRPEEGQDMDPLMSPEARERARERVDRVLGRPDANGLIFDPETGGTTQVDRKPIQPSVAPEGQPDWMFDPALAEKMVKEDAEARK